MGAMFAFSQKCMCLVNVLSLSLSFSLPLSLSLPLSISLSFFLPLPPHSSELTQLTGVAAILRFPIPGLDESSEEEEEDSIDSEESL